MGLGPVLAGPCEAQRAATQEVREPLAGAVEIAAQILARPEVAQPLLLDRRDTHGRQLAGGQQAGQALGVASIGLDPVGRRGISPGAQTRTSRPRSAAARASTKPVGPAS
jgi:hypothetical protein